MGEFSKQFISLAERHIGWAVHQSMLFTGVMPPAAWRYNLAERTMTIGDRTVPMAAMGTVLPEHKVFVWCYADSSLDPWPDVKNPSFKIRLYGMDNDIPEFTTGGVPIGDWEDMNAAGTRLALVAMGVLGARGYLSFQMHHGGSFCVLADDPALPAPEEPDPDQVRQVLDLATTYFPDADQLSVAACYVEALGGKWMQIPGGLSARFATAGMSLHYQENRLSWIGPSMS
jgi:hypothetical protein